MRAVSDNPDNRLVAATCLLVVAALAQALAFTAGDAMLGFLVVGPAVVGVFFLWRPSLVLSAAILALLGTAALLPLQTGGGRYQDWLLHYAIALHYAGVSSPIDAGYLAARTPLPHLLTAAALAVHPTYWVFQLTLTLLNTLWLWPSTLILRSHGYLTSQDVHVRLLAVFAGATVVSFLLYTWPWGFVTFFLMTALYLSERGGRTTAAGTGVAMIAALLAHPAALGYVLGLGIYIFVRRRTVILPAIAGGIMAALTSVPWLLHVTGGHLATLVSASPVRQVRVSGYLYVVTRVLVVATTILPLPAIEGLPRDRLPAAAILVVLVNTLTGAALFMWFATRGRLLPRGAALALIGGGALVSWIIYTPNNATTGMMDALFPGTVIMLLLAAARLRMPTAARLLTAEVALTILLLALLVWLSYAPVAGDPNLALKIRYHAVFLPDVAGPWPGVALLVIAATAAGVARLRTVQAAVDGAVRG